MKPRQKGRSGWIVHLDLARQRGDRHLWVCCGFSCAEEDDGEAARQG